MGKVGEQRPLFISEGGGAGENDINSNKKEGEK